MTRSFSSLCSLVILLGCVAGFDGCNSSKKQVLGSAESQVELRSIQSRSYDTTDRHLVLRSAMATLQDLGFVLDDADEILGTISATKLDRYAVRMTVSVRPRGERQMLVRANAQYNNKAVENPEPYQEFFDALSKSMFLAAHQVD